MMVPSNELATSGSARSAVLAGWRTLAAAALCGLLMWLALPSMVITMDDDFSYLRSVVETIQHGRPWTDEWLAPWAASSSALSAVLFAVSGDFPFAIHFTLALAGALAFAGLCRHLQDEGISFFSAAWLTLAVLLCPSVLNMHLMYTAVPLYWGCLWLCLCFAARRQWGWFFVFWAVAFASRQSAITWLALPGWPLLEHAWRHRSLRGLPRAGTLVLAGAAAMFLLIKAGMNPTIGRDMAGGGNRTMISTAAMLHSAGLALFAFGAGFGGRNLARLLAGKSASPARHPAWVITAGAAAGAALALWVTRDIHATHNCLGDAFAPAIIGLVGALGGAGIVLRAAPPRLDASIVALGSTLLLMLYRADFDYYFVDVFAWGVLAAARGGSGDTSAPGVSAPRWTGALLRAALVCVLLWDARCYFRLKLARDLTAGVITATEQALREKKLAPQDIGMAPFGYAGWHYARHFLATDARGTTDLAGFVRYQLPWDGTSGTGVVRTVPPEFKRHSGWLPTQNNASLRASQEAQTLVSLRRSVLWFWRAKFELKHLAPSGPRPGRLALDTATFQQDVFPLNAEEWARYIRERP